MYHGISYATFARGRAALPPEAVVVKGVCTAELDLYPLISPSIITPGGDVEATIRLEGPGRPPGNPLATAIRFRYSFFGYRGAWRGRYLIGKRATVYLVFNRRGRFLQAWVMHLPKKLKQ